MPTPQTTPSTSPRRVIRLSDAAMKLRLSYHVTHRLLMVGELEGRRERGGWVVYADSVDAAIARRAEDQDPSAAA